MKKLIISLDSYNWVKFCSGMVSLNPEDYIVVILFTDDINPIHNCVKLCKDAIFAQRIFDTVKIARKLGVKSLKNFDYDENEIDLHKLIAQLQLTIMLNGITEVYYQKNKLLENIFKNMKLKSKVFYYGIELDKQPDLTVTLEKETIMKKIRLGKMIIGNANVDDNRYFPIVEKFYN